MFPSLAEIRQAASTTARRTAFQVAGGAIMLVGAAFLIVALWIAIEEAFNALAAALVVAGVLLALGLAVMGLAPKKPHVPSADVRLRQSARKGTLYQPTGNLPPLAEAFLFGLAVSAQIKNRRR